MCLNLECKSRRYEDKDMAIRYEQDGLVVTITIDRPEARNSLDIEHFVELAGAWKRFRDDDSAWVAIVTGVEDVFCVGADLKSFVPAVTAQVDKLAAGDEQALADFPADAGLVAVLRDFDLYKPVIAAVNGICVAGGMELLGGCDIRIASTEATFGVLEARRGLFAGGGTTARLPRQIAFPYAMELLLLAERVPASRAREMGLLNTIVEPGDLLGEARRWADRICENGPLAVRATKEAALKGLEGSLREAYDQELGYAARVFATEDAREGPAAFAEKRRPVWQAR
jgi:enoyl-CoA hydratase